MGLHSQPTAASHRWTLISDVRARRCMYYRSASSWYAAPFRSGCRMCRLREIWGFEHLVCFRLIHGCRPPHPFPPMSWYAMRIFPHLVRDPRPLQMPPSSVEGFQTASSPTPPQWCGTCFPQLPMGLYMIKETCHMLLSCRIVFALAAIFLLVFTEHEHGINDYLFMRVKPRVRSLDRDLELAETATVTRMAPLLGRFWDCGHLQLQEASETTTDTKLPTRTCPTRHQLRAWRPGARTGEISLGSLGSWGQG